MFKRFFKNKDASKSSEEIFSTENLKKDLKGHTIRGGAFTLIAQISKFVIRIGSMVVLARLLVPDDYGLLGMVTVITTFIEIFKDLGLSAATIQKAEINHKQVSTLFWINIAMGFALMLFVAAIGPALAWFYSEPRLTNITSVLAINFLISSLGHQHRALLQRQMQFKSLAKIEISSILIGNVVAIILAVLGIGYWSLVFMQTADAIVNSIGFWLASGWRPGPPFYKAGIRSMLVFGGNLAGFRCVNYFSLNLDNILIGRFWGPQQLGLYAKAYQLLLLPVQQINNPLNSVALPALSALQVDPDRYRDFYRKAILATTSFGMPIIAFMFAASDKVILLMLGENWLGVVPLFQLLAPAAFVGTFEVATRWVYQSLGRTDRQLRAGLVLSILNVAIFFTSIRWGAAGIAFAYGISQPLFALPAIMYCYHGTILKLADFTGTVYKPFLASVGAALVIILFDNLLNVHFNVLIDLVIDGLMYALGYVGIWMLMPNGKETLLDMLKAVKSARSSRAKPA